MKPLTASGKIKAILIGTGDSTRVALSRAGVLAEQEDYFFNLDGFTHTPHISTAMAYEDLINFSDVPQIQIKDAQKHRFRIECVYNLPAGAEQEINITWTASGFIGSGQPILSHLIADPRDLSNKDVWEFTVDAGLMDFSIENAENPLWELPDGSFSPLERPAVEVDAGTVKLYVDDLADPQLVLKSNTTQSRMTGSLLGLDSFRGTLDLEGCSNLQGQLSMIPDIMMGLNLKGCVLITGNIHDDILDLIGDLDITNCALITGATSNFGGTGSLLASGSSITPSLGDLSLLTESLDLGGIVATTGDLDSLNVMEDLILTSCTAVTGDLADLPALTGELNLSGLTAITGDISTLQTVIQITLSGCSLLQGSISENSIADYWDLSGMNQNRSDKETSLINLETSANINGITDGTLILESSEEKPDRLVNVLNAEETLLGKNWDLTFTYRKVVTLLIDDMVGADHDLADALDLETEEVLLKVIPQFLAVIGGEQNGYATIHCSKAYAFSHSVEIFNLGYLTGAGGVGGTGGAAATDGTPAVICENVEFILNNSIGSISGSGGGGGEGRKNADYPADTGAWSEWQGGGGIGWAAADANGSYNSAGIADDPFAGNGGGYNQAGADGSYQVGTTIETKPGGNGAPAILVKASSSLIIITEGIINGGIVYE